MTAGGGKEGGGGVALTGGGRGVDDDDAGRHGRRAIAPFADCGERGIREDNPGVLPSDSIRRGGVEVPRRRGRE